MKRVRSVFFWLHLTAGSLGAVVILVMSFTGTVLALKPQIQNWVDRDVRLVTPPETPRLGASALLTALKAAKPEASVQSVAFDRDPGIAATINLAREGNVFVNPYDGAILGSPSAGTVQFFLDDLDNQYSETVPILDVRLDKTVAFGRYRVGVMLDAYNLTNGNPVSNFNIVNGTQFNRIIATLDPRAVQLGFRFEF